MDELFPSPPQQAYAAYALVALEQSIDTAEGGLTYGVPADFAAMRVGQRVFVPLGRGNKRVAGYVMQLRDACEYPRVKALLGIDPAGVSLPPDLVELARWMAQYYCCAIGMVLATMLPAAVKKGTGTVSRVWVRVADPLPETAQKLRSAQQKKALEIARTLRATGDGWVELKALADQSGARSTQGVSQLVTKGILATQRRADVAPMWSLPQVALSTDEALVLNEHQQKSVEDLSHALAAGFSSHVLYGVTGSGKTEVYLRLIEKLQEVPGAAGRCAIVLVPEIALTPQTVTRFMKRFEDVAVLHSGLTAAQRHDQWRRIHQGRARVVVGARSAVFAPFAGDAPQTRVGVIIVDEEHEHSYKQDQAPRYQARDLAIKRAQLLDIPVVLGSATPSLESYHNVAKRSYQLHTLPRRVAGLVLPKVHIVDMAEQRRRREGHHLISDVLENALGSALERGGQALLLLNRRGYANYIACPDHRCGFLMTCEFCDAMMIYHKDRKLPAGGSVRCHHCGAEQLLPATCPQCSKKIVPFGLGTQRVEEELPKKFPQLAEPGALVRMDSDTMRTARDYEKTLMRFGKGDIRVLVGTQMIAKGLDFPNVQVVGVIHADMAMNMPDFRSAERTFQLVAQVAGRAGRGAQGGEVVVQTMQPDDPAVVLASTHDYEKFAEHELAIRHEAGLPPFARMARIVVRDQDVGAAFTRAQKIAGALDQINVQMLGGAVRIVGPAACPIARIAGYHRQQIEIIAPGAAQMQTLLGHARRQKVILSELLTAVDVDPVSLM